MRILGTVDEELFEKLGAEVDDPNVSTDALSLLVLNQSILAHFVTALLAWIEPNSIVLFEQERRPICIPMPLPTFSTF